MNFELILPGRTYFGNGEIRRLGAEASGLGRRALVINGMSSARKNGLCLEIEKQLESNSVDFILRQSGGEPTVEKVDRLTLEAREAGCSLIIAAGGGSVLDLGKAVSGMFSNQGSIRDYLEGVGNGSTMLNPPVPLIVVPTTGGTGSEATRNAVISGGTAPKFKKSFRDARLLPSVAIIDPELALTCPQELTVSDGLDALTQLVEALTSPRITPPIEALALSGISSAGRGLPAVAADGNDIDARAEMACAAYLSGIALSHAGLGAVHALASSLGANFSVPHGTACARLLPLVTAASLEALRRGNGTRGLEAYGKVEDALGEPLGVFCRRFTIPGLGRYGMKREHIRLVIEEAGSFRTSVVELSRDELTRILEAAI